MTTKNPFSKSRKADEPYAIYKGHGFTWKILKTYQRPDMEKDNEYARWFVAASSPMTYGSDELGDTYISDIREYGTLVYATDEWRQHYG